MDFKINKTELLAGVGRMQGIVDVKSYNTLLSNVLLRVNKNGLTIISTDLEISLLINYPAEVTSRGEVLLPAKKLQDIIRVMPEGLISISCDDNFLTTISCSAKKPIFKLAGMPSDDFPIIKNDEDIVAFEEEKKSINYLLSKTLWSVSTVEEAKTSMTGVLFEAGTNSLRMVSSNGACLSVATLPNSNIKFDKGILVPLRGAKELLDFVKNKPEGKLSVGLGGRVLVMVDETAILRINLMEDEFPDYQRIIKPQDGEIDFRVGKADILRILERANVMSDENYHRISVEMNKQTLFVSASNENIVGEAKDEIQTDYAGIDHQFAINAKIIMDAIGLVDGDKVQININPESAKAPIFIGETKSEDYFCLIMPLS